MSILDSSDKLFASLQETIDSWKHLDLDKTMDEKLCQLYMEYGRYDLPNTVEKVDVDDPEWETIKGSDTVFNLDYVVQVKKSQPNFARLLKEHYGVFQRIARGHVEAMQEKQERLNAQSFFKPGDIIYIDRDRMEMDRSIMEEFMDILKDAKGNIDKISLPLPIYAHVGIYVGKGEVVHFSGKCDLVGERHIYLCQLKEFLNSTKTHKAPEDIYIMHFPGDGQRPYKLYQDTEKLKFNPAHFDAFETLDFSEMHVFTPAETVARAKSLVEAKDYAKYDFLHNNCEHLAFYCKTGKKFSVQAENLQTVLEKCEEVTESVAEMPKNLLDELVDTKYKALKEAAAESLWRKA